MVCQHQLHVQFPKAIFIRQTKQNKIKHSAKPPTHTHVGAMNRCCRWTRLIYVKIVSVKQSLGVTVKQMHALVKMRQLSQNFE